MSKVTVKFVYKGGPGSGHHGHAGLPGKHGGSAPGSGSSVSNRAGYKAGDRVKVHEEYSEAGKRDKVYQVLDVREREVQLRFSDGEFYVPNDGVYKA